ncbi:adenylyltransferase/sulfurtransferase MoeZ [Microbacterium aoyamense]|uniref:Adenylyltransferase/sulfurtransferase MoeZ n=1 Tax=Microbacterium aoyamense TaxID=344166 RepID=A0ABN2PRS3_9MICO|nr:ThiF family adenylyltransferase [Microbacterium aoyamense]
MPLPPLVEPVPALSDAERARTARHLVLAGLGELGQRRIAAAHVAVVGAGGLGSPVVLALAAAGVGTITIIDDDVVELSNLQRQVMHRREDAGVLKVHSAARAAAALSDTRVIPVAERLDATTAPALLRGAHLVIDGSDLFETRVAVAAGAESLGIPLVWGTVQEFDAQITTFWNAPPAGHAPVVLADLYPADSVGVVPSCADVGVLGALCMQVGSILALEALKLITGIGDPLLGRVLVIDALRARQHEVPLRTARTTTAAVPQERPITFVERDAIAGLAVIDVREDDEVAAGVIPGARHLPLAQLLADPAAVTGPVVLVCRTSVRSRRAAEVLRSVGVEAAVLVGGMEEWMTAGAPTVIPAPALAGEA